MPPRARCQPLTRITREPRKVTFANEPEYRSASRPQPTSMPQPTSYLRTTTKPCPSCGRTRDAVQGLRDQILGMPQLTYSSPTSSLIRLLANASRHFRANIRAVEQILGRNVHVQEVFDVVVHGSAPRICAALVSRGGTMYGPRGKYRLAEKTFWQGPWAVGVGAAMEGLLCRMARGMGM